LKRPTWKLSATGHPSSTNTQRLDHRDDVEHLRKTIARLTRDVAYRRRQADEAHRQLGAATREIAIFAQRQSQDTPRTSGLCHRRRRTKRQRLSPVAHRRPLL
jgi:hypothetical protein